jgi:hypothetical protein
MLNAFVVPNPVLITGFVVPNPVGTFCTFCETPNPGEVYIPNVPELYETVFGVIFVCGCVVFEVFEVFDVFEIFEIFNL